MRMAAFIFMLLLLAADFVREIDRKNPRWFAVVIRALAIFAFLVALGYTPWWR